MQRIVATIVSAGGLFSQFPVAFCSGSSDQMESSFDSIFKSNASDTSDDREPEKTLGIIGLKMPYGGKMPAKTLAARREKSSDDNPSFRRNVDLKKFIDEHHYNPCPLKKEDLKRLNIFQNLETYVIYPEGLEKINSYKPRSFPKIKTKIGLKAVYYTENSFTFNYFKSILASNFGRACILPLEVDDDDLTQMPLEVSNGKEYFFRGGFKVVIIGQGINEGKRIRFDFPGINDKDIEDYFKEGIVSDNIDRYNKTITKIRLIEIDNPYKMTTKTLDNNNSVRKIVSAKLVLDFNEREYVSTVPFGACRGCTFLKSVEIPDDVKIVSEVAFQNCKFLEEVTLPEGLRIIESSAFAGCENLKYINIPESVVLVGLEAFKGCFSLNNVEIPGSIKKIEGCTFQDCKNLKSVILEDGIEVIDHAAFAGCENLKFINIPKTVCCLNFDAFKGCTSLEEVVIPCQITSLKNDLFRNCKALKKIDLPVGLEIIENSAFAGCESLKFIDIPKTVNCLDPNVFAGCISLDNVVIPYGVRNIEGYTFQDCKSLKNISLPNGIKKIGEYAFVGCESLKSINIPKTVNCLEFSAFEECTSLDNVVVPSKVKVIGNHTFRGCKSLKNITLPSGLERINEFAFQDCKNLEFIEIPENVNFIGSGAFSGCDKLKCIKYGNKRYYNYKEFCEDFYKKNG